MTNTTFPNTSPSYANIYHAWQTQWCLFSIKNSAAVWLRTPNATAVCSTVGINPLIVISFICKINVLNSSRSSLNNPLYFVTQHRCTSIPNKMKDLGNIRSQSATLHIIYCYESHIFFKCHCLRDINLRFTAVLGKNISFYCMKRITLKKKQIISEIIIKRNDFGYFILKYAGSHILLEYLHL